MASYYPPTKNTAIFDSALFAQGDDGLTKAEADKAYVRYPTSQGPVTLLGLTCNGNSSFPGTNIVSGALTCSNTANFTRTTTLGTTTATKRINQVLSATTGFESVNGYYGLAKNTQPLANQSTSDVRLIQPVNLYLTPASVPINYEFMCYSPEAGVVCSASRSGGNANTQIIVSPEEINWSNSPYTATTNTGWSGTYSTMVEEKLFSFREVAMQTLKK
jgi:hypothetical protein